jgi:hypothetical protein
MNVSESIDWEHMTPEQLDGHRCIAQLASGAILDTWLKRYKSNVLQDADGMAVILIQRVHGGMSPNWVFTSINVLEESR